MKQVPLEDAEGMVPGEDVKDSAGNMLLKAGTKLSSSMISRLQSRNVSHVSIDENADEELSPEELEARMQEIEERVDNLFGDVMENPLMEALHAATKKHMLKNYSSQ